MTIVEFLAARLDEIAADWHERDCGWALFEGVSGVCDCGVGAFVVADIAAKRAIIADLREQQGKLLLLAAADNPSTAVEFVQAEGAIASLTRVLARFCLPFADHPDHDSRWKP